MKWTGCKHEEIASREKINKNSLTTVTAAAALYYSTVMNNLENKFWKTYTINCIAHYTIEMGRMQLV